MACCFFGTGDNFYIVAELGEHAAGQSCCQDIDMAMWCSPLLSY